MTKFNKIRELKIIILVAAPFVCPVICGILMGIILHGRVACSDAIRFAVLASFIGMIIGCIIFLVMNGNIAKEDKKREQELSKVYQCRSCKGIYPYMPKGIEDNGISGRGKQH